MENIISKMLLDEDLIKMRAVQERLILDIEKAKKA